MSSELKRIIAVFYRTQAGNEPVREWLKKLDKHSKQIIGQDIRTVEFGWPIGMPVCRPLGSGLYEVRSALKDTIARVLFCIHQGDMILLHGFVKKTQKTPDDDLALARKRKTDVERADD